MSKHLIIYTLFLTVCVFLVGCNMQTKSTQKHFVSYVNPFTGTDGPGNTFPGATVPFGMVQLSPDNGLPGWDRIAGYFWKDSTIAGFSHTHLSGTGAGDFYDLLVMPVNARFKEDLWPEQEDYRRYSMFSHDKEEASPGYYKVDLLSYDIQAELTTTERCGMHRYTFPADKTNKIILDLGFAMNWDKPTETYIKIENENTISGFRKSTGWARDQRVYFVMQFSKAFESHQLFKENKNLQSHEAKGEKTKIVLHFPSSEIEQVMIKTGISSVSVDGARKNLETEINHWDFDKVKRQAQEKWEKMLRMIEIEGTEQQKEVFYTNLYHCFVTPYVHSDVDGKYKGADGNEKQAKEYNRYDLFSLWDTYRTAHPLYTILIPNTVSEFVHSFLAHYDETGLLPVWTMAGNETNMMIGYHSVPVIVDAYFKGIKMDAEKAYEACKQTAESNAWNLSQYKKFAYIPYDKSKHEDWSVSKTLEYAYDDWCIAQFAKALGKNNDYKHFMKRASNWKNLFDDESSWIVPRDSAGNFIRPFSPDDYTPFFCESNAWHYFWHVQHDIEGLISLTGKEKFEAKLDSMFTYSPSPDDELPIFSTGMIGQYAHGNEPSHHVPWLYQYLGKPERTNELVHQIINTQYSTKPDGFCGNEDCGQMSAWMVMASLGVYPVNPADGKYHLNSPWVDEAIINLPKGKKLKITKQNYTKANHTIKEIKLNDKKLNDLIINHSDLMNGGELIFVF